MSGRAPRVLVDATAVPADRGGVGRYVDGLISALGPAGADFAVVCQRADAERFGRMAPEATHRAGAGRRWPTGPPGWRGSRPVCRWSLQQVGADVLHSPHYTMPLRAGRPVVVTIHDATFFTQPDVHTSIKGPFFRSAIKTALHRAARCVVPSKATRDELVRVLDADSTKIDVAYHGVDRDTFHVPSDTERQLVQARLGLRNTPYIAFLGMLEPRKNVPSLVRGWVKAVQDREEPPALVLAGGSGWDDEIDQAITEVPSRLRVLRPGYLRFSDLRGYLGGATVVAYPSHGEGFGLPVLEAMACGAAVLTTQRLSLPEVGGDAVAYTEGDPDSIAAGLAALLDDPETRRTLGEAAVKRAGEFTWAASAEAHLAAYARAAGVA